MELSVRICNRNDYPCRINFHFHAEIHNKRHDKRICQGMTGYISNIAHTVMTGKAVKQMKKMEQDKMQQIELQQIKVEDDFWSARQQLVTDVVIPYQERILGDQVEGVKKSHAFANFRIAAGLENGEFYGMEFQDSDVAKWLEAVAYALIIKPDPALEKRADEVIDTIFKA